MLEKGWNKGQKIAMRYENANQIFELFWSNFWALLIKFLSSFDQIFELNIFLTKTRADQHKWLPLNACINPTTQLFKKKL